MSMANRAAVRVGVATVAAGVLAAVPAFPPAPQRFAQNHRIC
jgi:hypothetical protein